MGRRARWCDHVAPVTVRVRCDGEQHRVTWRRGKLVLEDHDLGAERTMLAFGGERCACLQVLELWANLHAWAMNEDLFRQLRSRLGPESLLAPGELASVHELGLALSWERRWRRSAFFTEHERLLKEQLRKRAMAPLREHVTAWKQRHGCRLIGALQVEVQRPGRAPTLTGSMDRVRVSATATLGVPWLLQVWARGLAVVDGAFVLEVVELEGGARRGRRAEQDDVAVQAVRWEEVRPGVLAPVAHPAMVTVDAEGRRRLTWSEDPAVVAVPGDRAGDAPGQVALGEREAGPEQGVH